MSVDPEVCKELPLVRTTKDKIVNDNHENKFVWLQ